MWYINVCSAIQFSITLIMEFICKTCNKSFKSRSSLSRHGRIHKSLRVMCECGLSFSRRDCLNRHQESSSTCKIHSVEQATPQDNSETDSEPSKSPMLPSASASARDNATFNNSIAKIAIPKPHMLKAYPEVKEHDAQSSSILNDSRNSFDDPIVNVSEKKRKRTVLDDNDTYSDKSSVHVTTKRTALDYSDTSSDDSDNSSDDSDSSSHKPSVHMTSKKIKRVCMNKKNRRRRLEKQKRIIRLRKAKSTVKNLNVKRQYGDFSNMVRYPSYNAMRIPYHSNESLFNQLSSYRA
jgi:Zinc finger, C2H2 type